MSAKPNARGRRGNRAKASGNNNNKKTDEKLSRALSWALRHSAPSLGLEMSSDGYVPVDDLLSCGHNRFQGYTVDDVRRVVETNDKQRYGLCLRKANEIRSVPKTNWKGEKEEDMVLCIRANQGHTIPHVIAEELLERIPPTELAEMETIVHGTYWEPWLRHIQTEGLSRMKRNHIHLASGFPERRQQRRPKGDGSLKKEEDNDRVISGMRSNCQIYIYIDGKRCAQDEIEFYRSDNGVILTAGENNNGILPVRYFSKVVDASTEDVILDQSTEEDVKN